MRGFFLTILISFFMMLPFVSLDAKDIEIHGVNFEKKYDNVFSKIFFHFFIKEKPAKLIDIAKIKNDDHQMCLYPVKIDWEKEKCDEYSGAIADYQYFQEQRWLNSQIKPYVISSSDKNFNQQVLWIDSDSGRILKLNARAGRIGEHITKKITDKFEKQDTSYKLCREAIDFWFNKNVRAYNIQNYLGEFLGKLIFRIGDYQVEYECSAPNAIPLLQVEHDDYSNIRYKERKKLELNIK